MKDIIVLGFGGHAKSVADSICKTKQYNIIGYTDKKERKCKYRYLGTDVELERLYNSGIHKAALGVGFVGKTRVRDDLVRIAKDIGFEFPAVIDPSAIIAGNVEIGEGTFIGKQAVINTDAKVGKFCIINTGAIVEHENCIADYSHIAVGAVLCGNVEVGNHSLIGANTTVIQGHKIGDNCMIGAGSVVLDNVGDNMNAYGIIQRK